LPGGAARAPANGYLRPVIAPPPRHINLKPKKKRPPGIIKKLFWVAIFWPFRVCCYILIKKTDPGHQP
ncbi:hypothetical protein, partial [Enterobacter hormaechei]